MKLSIGFRCAEKSDIPFLLTLRKATMTAHLKSAGYHFTDSNHLDRINEYFSDSHIILNNQEPIGLIKLGVLAERLHIRQFQISPSFHGMGIGSFVLDVVKKKANELKLPITLFVLLDNPAKSLYLRHGFYVEEQLEKEYKMRLDIKNEAVNG